MKKMWSLALVGLLGLCMAAPLAHAQLRLVAQNAVLSTINVTPTDPSTFDTTQSGEIFSLDVPPVPSSSYVQFTCSAGWELDFTGGTPVRANFQLVFDLTSPALPPNVVLRFGVPLTRLRNNTGTVGAVLAGPGGDSEVFTRKLLAAFLLAENPSLTEVASRQIIDLMFEQGFHVSVSAQLKSQNVGDAGVINPNVAFFAQPGSLQ